MGWRGVVWYGKPRQFATAILYEIPVGDDSQIWLQDNGATPVLVATLPRRVALGWSTTGGTVGGNTLGFLLGGGVGGVSLDEREVTGLPGVIAQFNADITLTATGSEGDAVVIGARGGAGGYAAAIVGVGNPFNGIIDYQGIQAINGTGDLILTGPGSGTVHSIANRTIATLQRRPAGTFVYLRKEPYNSVSTPVPSTVTGDVFMASEYWTSPEAGDDITGSVVGRLTNNLPIESDNPFLDGQLLQPNVNLYSTKSYQWIPFDNLINGGAEAQGAVSIQDAEGNFEFVEFSTTGVTLDARFILSVAVYPV